MYFFFILFFVSLTAITLMIGRKLLFINNIKEYNIRHNTENFLSEILDFNKIKQITIENGGKIAHATIWIVLKVYIVSLNFINKKRKEIIGKIKNRLGRHQQNELREKKEVSKYIKLISEYRQKIKKIKHKIREEEGIE